jgi:hypothetical protein
VELEVEEDALAGAGEYELEVDTTRKVKLISEIVKRDLLAE